MGVGEKRDFSEILCCKEKGAHQLLMTNMKN